MYASRIFPINRINSLRSEVSGAGFSQQEALSAVLGEAVERYSWLSLSPDKVVLLKQSHLPKEFIPVEETGFLIRKDLLHNEVFRGLENVEIPCLEGKSLIDHRKVLIPAIDFFSYLLSKKEMRNWTILTTNGIATGNTFASACLYAIYEVIERDAVMQFWYHKKNNGRKYPVKNQCREIDQILEKCEVMDLKVNILNITTDLEIPTAFAFIYRFTTGKECFTCGAASRLSEEEASTKALSEAIAMWDSLPNIQNNRKLLNSSEISLDFPSINNFEDHVFLYSHPWAKEGYKFLFSESSPNRKKRKGRISKVEKSSPEKKLQFLIDWLQKKSYESFIVDITPGDIKNLGLYVVKAIIPGLLPFFVGKYGAFYMRRFRKNGGSYQNVLNKWPHPMP